MDTSLEPNKSLGVRPLAKKPKKKLAVIFLIFFICVGFSLFSSVLLLKRMHGFDLEDDECSMADARRLENPRKPIALAAFPRSGNVWVRVMIERVTGYVTTSVRCEKKFYELGFKEECGDPSYAICTRTFAPLVNFTLTGETEPESRESYEKAVIIARNPYDVIYLSYTSAVEVNGALFTPDEIASGKVPMWFAKKEALLYRVFLRYWTQSPIMHMEVKYEDLKSKPSTWGRIAFFMGAAVSDERVDCAINEKGNEKKVQLKEGSFITYSSLANYSKETYDYLKDYLRDELCLMGYNEDDPIKFQCDDAWERHKKEERAVEAQEEEKRRTIAKSKKEERQNLKKRRFWYDGLKRIDKKINTVESSLPSYESLISKLSNVTWSTA